jgi:hypothetical protein
MSQTYSASLVKKAQRFSDAQLRTQRAMQNDVLVPQLELPNLRVVGPKYRTDTSKKTANLYNVTKQAQNALNARLGYSYDIPEETKWLNRYQNVTDNGLAKFDFFGKDARLGKVFVPAEYWDFVVKEMEREQAMNLKAFIFNTMLEDFHRPEGKAYWKKRCPELFSELKEALKFKHKNEYLKAVIALEDPQTEEEWRFVYDHFIYPQAYATTQVLDGAVPEHQYDADDLPTLVNLKEQRIYNVEGSNRELINPGSAKYTSPIPGQGYRRPANPNPTNNNSAPNPDPAIERK